MPDRTAEPAGFDRLELPCIWIPDGEDRPRPGAMGFDELEIPAIWIPDGYEGPRPGYPWVEMGRMTLPAEPQPRRASADRSVQERSVISADETAKRTGWQTEAGPHETAATMPDTPDRSPPVSLTAAADYNGTADAVAWHGGYSYPDIAAAMRAWNLLSDPHAASAALNSVSDSSPAITSLAQYSPAGPVPVPMPPLFVPGTPENEDFVHSTIRAGQAVLDAIRNILHSEQSNDKPSLTDQSKQPSSTGQSDAGDSTGIEALVGSSAPGRATKGPTRQYDRPGGASDAQKDFDSLNPANVRPAPNNPDVRIGNMPDGRTVTVRPTSSDGRPTLEIYDPANGRSIKIRYGN